MNETEFLRLAAAFGADLSRWPGWSQLPAARLLRESRVCQAAILEAQELDAVLRAARPAPAPGRLQELAGRIVARRRERDAASGKRWPLGGWSTGVFLVGMLALGVTVGVLREAQLLTEPDATVEIASGGDLLQAPL